MTNDNAPGGEKKLTGFHVLMWVLGFFGVMLVANGFFIYYANTSWPGVEVQSPYNESQNFDSKIADAREQENRGWQMTAQLKRRQNDVYLVIEAKDKLGNALTELTVKAEVGRPVNEQNDQKVELESWGEGLYQVKLGALDPGRWRVKIEAYEQEILKFRSVGQTSLTQ